MKILIIDDDKFFLKFYSEKLMEASFTVIVASDGEEGLEKIRAENPDLVLLDLIMPKKDGFEVLKTLSNEQVHQHPRVLVFSTLDQQKDIEEAKKLGAIDYINKGLTDWNSTLAKISSYMPQ